MAAYRWNNLAIHAACEGSSRALSVTRSGSMRAGWLWACWARCAGPTRSAPLSSGRCASRSQSACMRSGIFGGSRARYPSCRYPAGP